MRDFNCFVSRICEKNLYISDWLGGTPLHRAAFGGHKDVAELLIASGADINAKNRRGQTALSLAKEKGHQEIVELLRKHGAKE